MEKLKKSENCHLQIEQRVPGVCALCKRFKVKHLFVFGSAVRNDFTETSDVDFLVEFERKGIKGSFDQYFGFKEALERLLERKVDLVCWRSIKNPVFRREVERSKKAIYAA